MMEALVQNDFDINLQHILRRMRTSSSEAEVISLREDDEITRASYAEVAERADRLAAALHELGVRESDRVATFAWNSQEHLEAYFAIPCMGAVLHTLNIRLFAEQLTFIVNHAEDTVMIVDDSLIKLLDPIIDTFETVKHWIVIGDGDTMSVPDPIPYEELLAGAPDGFTYPRIDGRAAASLCYTSGTTGNPKGVLYGHRSTVIHAMAECLTDTLDVRASDKVLEIVPMFHANAWGLPFSCGMIGASQVMPGRFLQPEPLAELIRRERPTFAAAVPTIWSELLRKIPADAEGLDSLRKVVCGGAPASRELMERVEARFDATFVQGFGMTETSPLVAATHYPAGLEGEEMWEYRGRTGRLSPLVEARIVDDDGNEQSWDGEATGELQLRGPWIASGYYGHPDDEAEKFSDDWLRTGDIATITKLGYIQITDRTKDVIKSGGEWISSVDLENAIMKHQHVVEAAVIGKPDEKWSERPLACVVLDDGAELSADELKQHLTQHVAKWWVPDDYAFIEEVPKTSVGKFDKKVLRQRLADGELDLAALSQAETSPA